MNEATAEQWASKPVPQSDQVNSPSHYTSGLATLGIEVIDITSALDLPSNIAQAVQYLLRAGKKGDDKIQELEKAKVFLDFEIRKLKGEPISNTRRNGRVMPAAISKEV